MASSAVDSVIHGFLFSTDEMREIFSDKSWAQKWLDTEAALAKAQGELGVIPRKRPTLLTSTPMPICLIWPRSASSTRAPSRLSRF